MADLALITNFLVSILIASVMYKSNRMSYSDPVFWYTIFHFFVFVIRPFFVILGEYSFVYNYVGYYPDLNDQIFTLWVTLWGYFSFCIGSVFLSLSSGGMILINRGGIADKVLEPQVLMRVCVVLLPLALYSVYKTIEGASFDGSSAVVMERIKGMAVNVNGNGYVNELRNLLPTLVLMVYVATRRSWLSLIFLGVFVAYRVYVGHGRFNLVMLFFGIALVEYYVFGNKIFRPKLILSAVVFAGLFYLLGENREILKSIVSGVESTSPDLVIQKKFLEGMDFANFEYLNYILGVVPDVSGTYHYGIQYLQLFTEPIPRVLWSGKPVGAPIEYYNLMDFGNWLGLTQSIVGDAWQNGGWAGLFITMFFWGGILTAICKKSHSGSDYSKLVWVIVVPYFLQMFRDGGVVTIFKFMLFSTLPFIFYSFFYYLSRRK